MHAYISSSFVHQTLTSTHSAQPTDQLPVHQTAVSAGNQYTAPVYWEDTAFDSHRQAVLEVAAGECSHWVDRKVAADVVVYMVGPMAAEIAEAMVQ